MYINIYIYIYIFFKRTCHHECPNNRVQYIQIPYYYPTARSSGICTSCRVALSWTAPWEARIHLMTTIASACMRDLIKQLTSSSTLIIYF